MDDIVSSTVLCFVIRSGFLNPHLRNMFIDGWEGKEREQEREKH